LFIKAETMKKLFVVFFCISMGAAAMAQSGPEASKVDKERTMKNLREDVKAHEDTKHVVGNDLTHLRFRRAIDEHKEVARTHRMVDADSKVAKAQGISHPVVTARRQLHAQSELRRS
jgi:hypothetical protein